MLQTRRLRLRRRWLPSRVGDASSSIWCAPAEEESRRTMNRSVGYPATSSSVDCRCWSPRRIDSFFLRDVVRCFPSHHLRRNTVSGILLIEAVAPGTSAIALRSAADFGGGGDGEALCVWMGGRARGTRSVIIRVRVTSSAQ